MNAISNLFLVNLLITEYQNLQDDAICKAEEIAENANEAALYGDGPVGSHNNSSILQKILREKNEIADWWNTVDPPKPEITPEPEEDDSPF